MNDLDRMKELIHTLNEAGKAYYQQNKEVMSNLEYDKMYDELLELEKKTNTVLSNSPTIHVGYELMTALEKEAHPISDVIIRQDKGARSAGSMAERPGRNPVMETRWFNDRSDL